MNEVFSALWVSVVRTIVPLIVNATLATAVVWNIPLDPEFEKNLVTALTLIFTTIYYVAVRLFETYISPKIGWLLGWAKSPDSYSTGNPGKHEADAPGNQEAD